MNSSRLQQSQMVRAWSVALCGLLLSLLAGCTGPPTSSVSVQRAAGRDVQRVAGGDAERGAALIQIYGCGACHSIPGIPGANAMVGPPLDGWADRHYIAGALLNEPENLISWIRFPQAIEPGNAMPNMGVTEQEARDISAYLYTLTQEQTVAWWEVWE